MQFSLGFIKSPQQFILRNFKEGELDKGIIMDLSEIGDQGIQGIVFPNDLSEDSELIGQLSEEARYLPIKSDAELGLTSETFETMDLARAKNILMQLQGGWVLQNNIILIEEMFATLKRLRDLLPNDRTAFFEELWFNLKINLGANNLKLIFNDIELAKKQGEKNKLIHILVQGKKNPEPQNGGDMAANLMKAYDKSFGPLFEIVDYNEEKGELVAVSSINKSPVLIMANVISLTRIQKAALKALFEGLQSDALA